MTLQEMMNNGYNLPVTDTITTQLIIDWFSYRSVFEDTEYWKKLFERQVNQKYPYYRQLQRIDPTLSNFDWLIESYNETQTIHNNSTQFVNKSQQLTTTTNDLQQNTTSSNNSNTVATTTNDLKTADTGTLTITDVTGNENSSETGGFRRAQAHARSNPMSASYTESDLVADKPNITIGNKTITDSTYGENFAEPSILNPTTSTDGLDREETLTHESGETTTDRTEGHTYNISNTGSVSDTSNTTIAATNSTANTGTIDVNGTKNDTNTGTTKDETTVISSGRNTDISTLITKAKQCIENSNSWRWLYSELDKCFICVYDI